MNVFSVLTIAVLLAVAFARPQGFVEQQQTEIINNGPGFGGPGGFNQGPGFGGPGGFNQGPGFGGPGFRGPGFGGPGFGGPGGAQEVIKETVIEG